MYNTLSKNKVALNIENEISREENSIMKQKVQKITAKESELLELHKIEKMIVDALKEYIKAIEQDCDKLISEGNTVIKAEGVS